jgi:UDP-N-acetyl-D-galactosamine dehydrogenase
MNLTNNKIGVIGLGYVGLPLSVEFGKKFNVLGFDINPNRICDLQNGIDVTNECSNQEISDAVNLKFSNCIYDLKDCNIYIVTVPTPIDKFKAPDLKPLMNASKMIGTILKKGDIVIYESTVYPGCTEEDCVPVLEESSKLKFNIDFYCGYSPERINPGDKINTLKSIKKVTSGSTVEVAEKVDKLYSTIITAGTHKASSIKVAEASKAIENAQRDLNISFMNELALIFDRIGIDTTDVIEAASTKWNFLKFKPGLVGGHCIGVDPYYLAHKAESLGYISQVILSGRRVNDSISSFIANKVVKLLIQRNQLIKNSKVLLLGLTFKENCPDIRNTKSIDIYNELVSFGFSVDIYDPWANASEVHDEHNVQLISKIEDKYSAIVLAVAHKEFLELDYASLRKNSSSVIFDCKSFLPRNIIDGRL